MANTFITPTVVARTALATLYNTIVVTQLVWRDFDPDFTGKQGDTITVRKPATFTAEEFVRASGITIQEATESSDTIVLDKIADVSFAVTSEDLTLEIQDFESQLLVPASEAIAQKIDGDLAEALIDAAESVGGGGTVVAAQSPNPHTVIVDGRTVLTTNKLPLTERYGVFSPVSTGTLLKDDTFKHVDKSGSTDALLEASIGRKFGVDNYESQVLGTGAGDRGQADGVIFHRHAVALASRLMATPQGVASEQVATANYKGLALRTVMAYDVTKKQDVCSIDFLYGVKTLRKEAAVQVNLGWGS
jgi:hypothetical protein